LIQTWAIAIAMATEVVGLGANHLPGRNCAEAL
jgi:hypothetical protein